MSKTKKPAKKQTPKTLKPAVETVAAVVAPTDEQPVSQQAEAVPEIKPRSPKGKDLRSSP